MRSRTGCTCSRTRRTTIPRRSSRSAARQRAWAAPSATPCRAAATCTRPCASPVRQIRLHPCPRRCPASCRSASWSPRPLPAIPATATKSAWRPARSTSCITPVTWPSAWRSAPLWPQRRPTMCAAKRPRRATWWCCWAAAPGVTASAAPRAAPRSTTWSRWSIAAPRCRRATRPRSARSSACSAAGRPRASSSAATTSARAACPWPSASWPTACAST